MAIGLGWVLGLRGFVNVAVMHLNGSKNREHTENLRRIEREAQEAEKQKDRDLQAKLHRERMELEKKIAAENNRILKEEGEKNRKARLDEVELTAKYRDHWPLIGNLRSDLLSSYQGQGRTPLRIFPVFQGFDGVDLSATPTQFLQQCYRRSNDRPVQVLDHAWSKKYPAAGGAVRGLFVPLRSEPMLFLFIKQEGQEISFRVSYWGFDAPEMCDEFLLTEQEGSEILRACAQKFQGQAQAEKLAIRECGRVLSKCMTLMGAFFTDAHYLLYDTLPPQLPQLLPQLLEGIEQIPTVQRLVGQVMEAYEEVLTAMKVDRASLVPDLALDMAEALVSVNRGYAQAKLNYALSSWLKLRTNQTAEGSSLLRLVGEAMGETDKVFLQKLRQVNVFLKNSQELIQIDQFIPKLRFQKLKNLLQAKKWKEADNETYLIMKQFMGCEPSIPYTEELPLSYLNDLKIIDDLWVQFSQGRFGFSVQKEIYIKCSGKLDDVYPGDPIWTTFCSKVGWYIHKNWKTYYELSWDGTGERGHLPIGLFRADYGNYSLKYRYMNLWYNLFCLI